MENKSSILIIDDDKGMLETLKPIFTNMNYIVISVNDGYKAIESVKEIKFDFILLDIIMPKINGIETLKKIKKIDSSIKVIMMTGYTDKKLVKKAMKEGALKVFYKPINIEELINIVNKHKKEPIIN